MSDRNFNGAVLDITALPTEANHERTYHLDLVAPDDLATVVMGVPQGSNIPVDITVRSLNDGVLFEADTTVHVKSQCVRCLDPIEFDEPVHVSEMFFTPEAIEQMREEHGDEGVEDLRVLDSNQIELEPLLRDAIVLGFPFQPVCDPDCEGLCDVCGKKWRDLPEGHKHEVIDPRFAKLAGFFDEDKKDKSK